MKQTDYQAWTLDGLDNFAQFNENGDGQGGWALEQERTVNAANEITGLAQGQGQAAWFAPLYDAAGCRHLPRLAPRVPPDAYPFSDDPFF